MATQGEKFVERINKPKTKGCKQTFSTMKLISNQNDNFTRVLSKFQSR